MIERGETTKRLIAELIFGIALATIVLLAWLYFGTPVTGYGFSLILLFPIIAIATVIAAFRHRHP